LSSYSLAADGAGGPGATVDSAAGDVSLLTAYLANSFVPSPGEGMNADTTASSAAQDFLTRPIA
jgi:hypothetical protein